MGEADIVVIGTKWRERQTELAYVTRSIAAAASRWAQVSVLVPGEGPREADGAFDLLSLTARSKAGWTDGLSQDCVIIVDELTPELVAHLPDVGPRGKFYLSASTRNEETSWRRLPLTDDSTGAHPFVSTYVPINPSAEIHRHNGFGFTDYLLVLSNRRGGHDKPVPVAAWLTAAFYNDDVIVVEDAVASAWRGRALRGRVSVDSRMDLWRLMAHANTCIDLAPGRYVARECVEALRFGTPIVVPLDSGPAVLHARSGGGTTFGDPWELLQAAATTRADDLRSTKSRRGREYANANHGDPSKFTQSLRALLADGGA